MEIPLWPLIWVPSIILNVMVTLYWVFGKSPIVTRADLAQRSLRVGLLCIIASAAGPLYSLILLFMWSDRIDTNDGCTF